MSESNDDKIGMLKNGETIKEIEARLRAVEVGVAEINKTLKYMAKTSDLSEMKNEILKWMIGTIIAVSGLATAIMHIFLK